MNNTKRNLHWYDGHMGCLYFDEKKLEYKDLYCEQCGSSDEYINNWSTWKDAYLGLVDKFSDDINNYDSQEEIDEYYDPEYCMYDKKYICEKCNEAYGLITISDFLDIMKLKNKKILIQVRLWDKDSCKADDINGTFAGYFVIENNSYKFNSGVDSEEWDDMYGQNIKWFAHLTEFNNPEQLREYDDAYVICFDLSKEDN